MGDSTFGYPEPPGYTADIDANPDTIGEPVPLVDFGAVPGGRAPASVTGGLVDARPLKRTLSLNKRVNVVQGTAAVEDLGFNAHSVIVDNMSGQWLFEGASRRWVPPSTIGSVIQFPSGCQVLSVAWTAPPGVTQPAGTSGSAALLIYCEDMLDPSPGTPLGGAGPAGPATAVTGSATPGDAVANPTTAIVTESLTEWWNGATWVRAQSGSAADLALKSSSAAAIVQPAGQAVVSSNPAAGTAASASQAAGGAGVRNVCVGVTFVLSATTALAGITTVTVNLRDGASGAGTILASWQVTLPAATLLPTTLVSLTGLSIPGSAATAMTFEGSAAVGNLMESATLITTTAS